MFGYTRVWLAAVIGVVAIAAGDASAADRVRVGEGPFITGGAFYVAREKGYFRKLGPEIETKQFIDGALAVPSMISGEVDLALMTPNASLFNSIAKGAPLVLFLDRGGNRKGSAYTLTNVTQALYDAGVHSAASISTIWRKRC